MQSSQRIQNSQPETAPAALPGVGRRRVEAVVETLAMVGNRGETLAEVAHDARNMVTALGLYCDLLDEPGVLAAAYTHYASELRLVAAASRRLVEKMVALDAAEAAASELPPLAATPDSASSASPGSARPDSARPDSVSQPAEWSAGFTSSMLARRRASLPAGPEPAIGGHIRNLAAELLANRNLLAAIAGPGVALTVETRGGALPVAISSEDLTRILVNLVKNSAEAMAGKGRIEIVLAETDSAADRSPRRLALTLEDNGPGIEEQALEKIFETGYTTHTAAGSGHWRPAHRGLGLAITRSILEAAGGRIHAARRREGSGARLEIELPAGVER